MERLLPIANAVLAVAYPFVVWWALAHWSARSVGLVALAVAVPLVALRARRAPPGHRAAVVRVPAVVLALLGLAAISGDARFVLALPVAISLALLALFAGSLRGGASIVESFARMQEPELSPAQVAHCREATLAWCAFFVVNASIAGALALAGARDLWALYTGGIAYALMGVMFAGEYLVRQARFRRYGSSLVDRGLARLWPPPSESEAVAARSPLEPASVEEGTSP